MGSPFRSRFVGNEFIGAEGAGIPRPDETVGLFDPIPLSEVNTDPIGLFSPENINRLIFTSPPASPISDTSASGASGPLDLFDIGNAGPIDSINAGTTTPENMLGLARSGLGSLLGGRTGIISGVAGIAGPETASVAKSFGALTLGSLLGPLGLAITTPFAAANLTRTFAPETFLAVGELLGLVDPVERQIADLFAETASAFGDFGFDDPAGLDLGAFGDLSAADFDPGFGGFDTADAENAAAGFETGVGDPGGGEGGESAGGTGSGGDTGGADSEGEGEAESGGGDSDF